MKPKYLVILLLLLIAPLSAAARTDYLLIPDPSRCTIYNRYQQPASAAERALFLPYSPLAVIERESTLGDQITPASIVKFQGERWFLLAEAEGRLVGADGENRPQVFSAAIPIGDTVEVVRGGVLRLTTPAGDVHRLETGEAVVRIFESGNRYYISSREGYGWSSLEPGSALKKRMSYSPGGRKDSVPDSSFPASLRKRIELHIERVNDRYEEYFGHFNEITGERKIAANWSVASDRNRIVCSLDAPYGNTGLLEESTRELVREIENLLVGSSYRVVAGRGSMVIERR